MMGGNRPPGNLNIKADAFAGIGASDAEVAQAQAEYRNQGIVGIGPISALQSSGQSQSQQHQMGNPGIHQRVRSSSNNSGLNVSPSFGVSGLAGSVLGNAVGQQL